MESDYTPMSYHNGFSGYNTRRSAHLNACNMGVPRSLDLSHSDIGLDLSQHHYSQDEGHDEYMQVQESHESPISYIPTTTRSESPFDYIDTSEFEQPLTRKRTNTSSSNNAEKRTANKVCRVCGDRAFSYNFNVITCESCKAFFRRNANKLDKEIRCPFNEQCEINVVSRRFCQRCRLAKCFEVGMKKEWIMSDEARLEKKQRVEENRERRLQDAICRVADEELKNDNILDEQMTVREFVLASVADNASNSNMLQNGSCNEYVGHSVMNNSSHMCASHHLLDTISSTGSGGALADVSASTTIVPPSLDINPATTMTSNGFIPPNPNVDLQDTNCGLEDMQASIQSQSNSIMAAQIAAQVQVHAAAISQQQQFAAEVLAQQVAANIVNPSTVQQQQLTIEMMHQPTHQSTIPQQIIPGVAPSSTVLMNPLANPLPDTELVTIPREMLLQLIQNHSHRATNCICTCVCGRYPPGAAIVDEVTKDLLSSGGPTLTEVKDETKLETAEDFQLNGLLPSNKSSVQWLSSSAPQVDPTHLTEEVSRERRDSLYNTNPLVDHRLLTPADNESRELSIQEKERFDEISDMANNWIENGMNNCCLMELFTDGGIEMIVRTLKMLSPFQSLVVSDQQALIKNGVFAYGMVKWLQHHEEVQLEGADANILSEIKKVLENDASEIRKQPGAFNVLSVLVLFTTEGPFLQPHTVQSERQAYEQLLKKVLITSHANNNEFSQLMDVIPIVRRSSFHLAQIVGDIEDAFIRNVLQYTPK